MSKEKITREKFELIKSLCVGKRGTLIEVDPMVGPIYEITEYDVEAELLEKYEIIEEKV